MIVKDTRAAYLGGKGMAGWCCTHCHRRFPHEGKPLRSFGALLLHKAGRHRKVGARLTGTTRVVTTSSGNATTVWTLVDHRGDSPPIFPPSA